jgi:hypothetical protein
VNQLKTKTSLDILHDAVTYNDTKKRIILNMVPPNMTIEIWKIGPKKGQRQNSTMMIDALEKGITANQMSGFRKRNNSQP